MNCDLTICVPVREITQPCKILNPFKTTQWDILIQWASIFLNSSINSNSTAAEGLHVKHLKWEPEGVQRQLEGCNRILWPKAAVAKVYMHGNKSQSF